MGRVGQKPFFPALKPVAGRRLEEFFAGVVYSWRKDPLTVEVICMRDKTDQILQAALRVFLKKGYLQATTQEIAKDANVAELTLFRKFSTKKNLFLAAIRPVVEQNFNSRIVQLAETADTDEFFKQILEDRLETLSRNAEILNMLIAESIQNHLTAEVDLPKLIFSGLKRAIEEHFFRKNRAVDADRVARLLGGVLLGHLMWPAETPYHLMRPDEKEKLVGRYVKALVSVI